jgi:hypothetical protein
MDILTVMPSTVLSSSGQSEAKYLADPGESITVFINILTFVGAGTIAFSPQWSPDKQTWYSTDTGDIFNNVGTVKKVAKVFPAHAPFFRMSWNVTGIVSATTEIKAMMREGMA